MARLGNPTGGVVHLIPTLIIIHQHVFMWWLALETSHCRGGGFMITPTMHSLCFFPIYLSAKLRHKKKEHKGGTGTAGKSRTVRGCGPWGGRGRPWRRRWGSRGRRNDRGRWGTGDSLGMGESGRAGERGERSHRGRPGDGGGERSGTAKKNGDSGEDDGSGENWDSGENGGHGQIGRPRRSRIAGEKTVRDRGRRRDGGRREIAHDRGEYGGESWPTETSWPDGGRLGTLADGRQCG